MSDTASDSKHIEPATTEGLEDLFEAEVVPGTTGDYLVAPTEGIPVDEAAKVLRLSVKTIKDRLRKGTLSGYKIQQKFGEKWMVCLGRDYQVLPGATEFGTPYQGGPTESVAALVSLLKAKDRELQAATYRNGYLEAQLSERDHQLKLLPDLQAKATEVELLKKQLASLEAQLSEQKTSHWARFKKWFLGQ